MRTIGRLTRGVLPLAVLAFAACGETPAEELPPPTIEIAAPTRTVSAGATLQLSAVVTEANGSASRRRPQWTSTDPAVATVNGSGVVTGVGGGTAIITANVGGAADTLHITGMRAPNPGGPQSTFLSFASQPGDYIGGGATVRYNVGSGTWTAFFRNQPDMQGVWIRFDGGGINWWDLNLAAPRGQPLRVGAYEGATRWPFQEPTEPGLAFSGNGRGCNMLRGRFVIHDIAIDHEGKVHRLHATFRQHCENGPAYLDGEIAVLLEPVR